MDITVFEDQYDDVAPLLGCTPDEARQRDLAGGVHRWIAWRGGRATAAVTAAERPDARTFLQFAGQARAIPDLAAAAASELGVTTYTNVDAGDDDRVERLRAAGFVIEITTEAFVVPFDAALRRLRRAWVPAGYAIISAADSDRDGLFRLDNAIRNDVPGCDGWSGNREWFDDELETAPPFDRGGYLVMVSPTGAYVGLVRMWRNPSGPRLGLVGTLRSHRTAPFAAALLRQCLATAAHWGHAAFTTEASLSNPVTHPALVRLGAERRGSSHQLVRATT